jgi:chromosome segregation ATPase
LYIQWETEKKKIDDYLSTLLTNIEDLAKKENTISKRITRFFLGKKNQFADLKSQISELQNVDFSNITKDVRDEKIMSINEISSKISSHSREIDKENKKALLDEEIEKLQQQVDEQKAKLTKKETEISEKEGNKIKLNEELQSIEEKSETTDKEDKNIMEELSSKVKSLKDKIKELETFIKRDEDDKNKIAKEIKRLENSIESKKSEKQKIDSQDEKAVSSLTAFSSKKDKKQQNSNATKGFEIQNLPWLPQTGKLFSANGNLYLAIENWEEYDDGMSEAKRLNAKLCATK